MTIQFHQAIQSILEMPYYKNDHAQSGKVFSKHEEAVAERIRLAGFTEFKKSQFPKLKPNILKKWVRDGDDTQLRSVTYGLPPGSYILQPANSQGFPDILVKDFNDRYISVECKSVEKNSTPMWNDNLPRPDSIYVLSSGITNSTTVFLGKDVITPEEQRLMIEQEKLVLEIVKQYNEKMKELDKFNRGWILRSRKQHSQGGGGLKTNYFTHTARKLCEDNVLEYALK